MAFVARFPQGMEAGQVYDLVHDLVLMSDSLMARDMRAAPRLQVVDCRTTELKLDLEFNGAVPPVETDQLTSQFCREARVLLIECGETRVRLSF